MNKADKDKVIAALEGALNNAIGHNWQYDIDECNEAITIMRGLAEDAEPTVKQSLTVHRSAEDYLRYRYGAYRGHFAWRELEEAYSQGRYDEEMLQGPNPYPGEEPSPQAAQTALQSESLAQAAQALAQPPSEGKPIEALAPVEIKPGVLYELKPGGVHVFKAQTEAALSEVVRLSEDAGLYGEFTAGKPR